MSFRLQSLLDTRCRDEKEAERHLTGAVAARVASDESQRLLEECAAAARARLATSRTAYDGAPHTTVAQALESERYHARLEQGARAAEGAALTHRKGALAAAHAREDAARESLAAARRAREALEQVKEREAREQRRLDERRAEEAAGDLTASRRPPRR